jgi:hypothetical protein
MLTPLWLSMARGLPPSGSGSTGAQDRAPPLPPSRIHTRHHPSQPVLPLSLADHCQPATLKREARSPGGGSAGAGRVCACAPPTPPLPRPTSLESPLRFAPRPDRSQRSLHRLSCVELPLAAATHDDGARGGVAPKRMGAVGIDPTTTALHKVPHPPFSVPELPQGTEEVDSYAKYESDALPTELCTLSH